MRWLGWRRSGSRAARHARSTRSRRPAMRCRGPCWTPAASTGWTAARCGCASTSSVATPTHAVRRRRAVGHRQRAAVPPPRRERHAGRSRRPATPSRCPSGRFRAACPPSSCSTTAARASAFYLRIVHDRVDFAAPLDGVQPGRAAGRARARAVPAGRLLRPRTAVDAGQRGQRDRLPRPLLRRLRGLPVLPSRWARQPTSGWAHSICGTTGWPGTRNRPSCCRALAAPAGALVRACGDRTGALLPRAAPRGAGVHPGPAGAGAGRSAAAHAARCWSRAWRSRACRCRWWRC